MRERVCVCVRADTLIHCKREERINAWDISSYKAARFDERLPKAARPRRQRHFILISTIRKRFDRNDVHQRQRAGTTLLVDMLWVM
jgi:hypothetical protein